MTMVVWVLAVAVNLFVLILGGRMLWRVVANSRETAGNDGENYPLPEAGPKRNPARHRKRNPRPEEADANVD